MIIETSESMYDESPVEINSNQKRVALKGIVDAIGALRFLHERIQKEDLVVSTRNSTLGLAGHALDRIGKNIGHEQDIERELRADSSNIRQLNEEIKSLKNQLAQCAPKSTMGPYLRKLDRLFNEFWHNLGFLTVRDSKFVAGWNGELIFEAEASLYMDKHSSMFSETPVDDDKAWENLIEDMRGQGVALGKSRHNDSPAFIDESFNKMWLLNKLTDIFPGAKIHNWSSYHGSDYKNQWSLSDCKVRIPVSDLAEHFESLSEEHKEKL